MVGEKIGNYQVVERLGAGGMGEVFVAEHEILHHRVAVKKLLPELSQNREVVARFFNEAKAATRVDHPGIVKVSDTGYAADGSAYFIMELLKGESLAARMRWRKVLPPEEVARIGRQTAGVLARAHEIGIIHRDLKPDNLFLVPDPDVVGGERVKVLDFGIAKLAEDVHAVSVKTRFGSIMGTPFYMSPEQCRSAGEVDARADVYSLGCILFELACGRPPFVEGDSNDILQAQKHTAPPSPRTLNRQVTPALERLILRMLAKQPERRPASMTELAAELEALATVPPASARRSSVRPPDAPTERELTGGSTTLGGAAGQAGSPAGSGRAVPWVAGLVILAAAAAVAVFWVKRHGGAYAGRQVGASAAATTPTPAATPAARPTPAITLAARPAPAAAADAAAATAPSAQPDAALPAAPELPANAWVTIAPPGKPLVLGVPRRTPAAISGFRRVVAAPAQPYQLEAHEVTWGELTPYLTAHPQAEAHAPAELPADPAARARWPATGIPWTTASAYCRDRFGPGADLPTEAEWEYAARGPALTPYPWGQDPPTPSAGLAPVMTRAQDRTPNGLYDLAGNAQEWTADAWIGDAPGPREAWAKNLRAVRGLPLDETHETVAHRTPLCGVACGPDVVPFLAAIGFRCARPGR